MKKDEIKIHPLPDTDRSPIKKESGQLALDIYQTEKEIVILAPVAGVSKDDITLSLTDEVLVIKGARVPREVIAEDSYYTRECFWGDFSRSIVLPLNADSSNIKAAFENNVLEIRIPKKDEERTKVISIKN